MSTPIRQLIRNRIEKVRKSKGISAHKIEYALGKTHPYGLRIGAQKHQPSIEDLELICDLLDVEPEELVYLDFSLIGKLKRKVKK